jgi:hypothetical protein
VRGEDPRATKRTTEDLHFNPVGGPAEYAYTTDKPVHYVAVAAEAGILGYLWAADEDDAAGYEPRPALGDDAFNAGVSWHVALRRAKSRGIPPSQALAELAEMSGGKSMGRVVAGSEADASSLADLKEIAGQ